MVPTPRDGERQLSFVTDEQVARELRTIHDQLAHALAILPSMLRSVGHLISQMDPSATPDTIRSTNIEPGDATA